MNAQNLIIQLRADGWSDNRIAKAVQCSQPTISRIRLGLSDPRESLVRAIESLYQQQQGFKATAYGITDQSDLRPDLPWPPWQPPNSTEA